MSTHKSFQTEQEEFWAGQFGNDYINRNDGAYLLASNLRFFSLALQRASKIGSCIEFGANIGMNLKALKLLYPDLAMRAIEINAEAADRLSRTIGQDGVFRGSILDYQVTQTSELALIKGVLIHLNPEVLPSVYEKLYQSSSRYVLVCEYYNPAPVAITYRGHSERLFKRDFAGELMEQYPDLVLQDYGFAYRRDPAFPLDDISWFLMEKRS